jgi:peptide/nickel transport system permease protein
MAKMITPEMERINKRLGKRKHQKYTYWSDAWKRLKRNKLAMVGLGMIGLLVALAIFAGAISPYYYSDVKPSEKFLSPNAEHWFGTDQLGRDIFSRCIYAARVSLPMGLICSVFAVSVGGLFGLVSAFFMGKTDTIVMRVMDVLMSIPGTLMAICIVATLGTGIVQLVLSIAISSVPIFARTVRSAVLTVRDDEYIEASRTIGASNARLMARHIIPNCVGHVIIFIVGSIAGNILVISGMSYIGLGIQPPTPEWGSLLSSGKTFIQSYPYMVIFPGLFILATVFAFNLFGDGVRDAFDPRLK